MNYVIEKEIPIPPKARRSKYPFDSMDVGDSFEATDNVRGAVVLANRALAPKRFLARAVGGGKVRAWRVE